jgi:ABC-type uncharacterized transport system substrate-binding protein
MLPGRDINSTRMRRLLVAYAVTLAVIGLPMSAAAHPHVFIDAVTTFQFNRERKIDRIALSWHFDDLYSSMLIDDFDRNRNGRFDPVEVQALYTEAFVNLWHYNFFTHIWVDGKERKIEKAHNFQAYILGQRIYYQFEIVVTPPIDPVKQHLDVGVFDPTYYTAFEMAPPRPVLFSGSSRPSCTYKIYLDQSHPIYYGAIAPHTIKVHCANG